MITNLIASIIVTLVTNTTEHYPQHSVSDPAPPGEVCDLVYLSHLENDANATEKIVVTEIKEVTTVHYECAGSEHDDVVAERVLQQYSHKEQLAWRATVYTNGVMTFPPPVPLFGPQ